MFGGSFDGSHVRRREMNLGGRTSSRSRQTTLELAKQQREKRRLFTLQTNSATCVQRHFKGYSARKHVAGDLSTKPLTPSLLSFRLSSPLLHFWPRDASIKSIHRRSTTRGDGGGALENLLDLVPKYAHAQSELVRFAQQKLANPWPEPQSEAIQSQEIFVYTRIVQAALIIIWNNSKNNGNDSEGCNVLAQFVLQCCLQGNCRIEIQAENKCYNQPYSLLLYCLQSYMMSSAIINQQSIEHETCKSLFQATMTTFSEKHPVSSSAPLAMVLLSIPQLEVHPLYAYISSHFAEHVSWQSLVTALSEGVNAGMTSFTTKLLLETLIVQRETTVLINVLKIVYTNNKVSDTESLSTIIRMLHYTLERRPEISWLASAATASDALVSDLLRQYCQATPENKQSSSKREDMSTVDMLNKSFSSEDDDEEDEDFVLQSKSPLHTSSTNTSKISGPTRSDYSTTKSLDASFKRIVSRQRMASCARSQSNVNDLLYLVELLAKGDFLLQLGMHLFSSDKPPASLNDQVLYCKILYGILSDSTGYRANSTPLLSQLAFCPGRVILLGIWNHTFFADERSVTGTVVSSVFCDLLTHTLLTVDDEEFSNCFEGTTVDPARIVRHLNHELYDLYWARPVLSTALSSQCEEDMARFRLLLSGTKVYNSLYERWSRINSMHRKNFCDESDWWWSRLVSSAPSGITSAYALDGGSAVVATLNQVMEIDSDSDDDAHMLEGHTQNDPNDDATLANSFRDPKLARVLTACPQVLPFVQRVKMFSSLLEADKKTSQNEEIELQAFMMSGEMSDRLQIKIHRDNIYEDSLRSLNTMGKKLRRRVQVTMINKHGTEESGIDGGGVFKEFLDELIREAFDPSEGGLFAASPVETLYVNPSPFTHRQQVEAYKQGIDMIAQYEFLGRVLGKAVYESVLVDLQFSLPFLNLLLAKRNSLDDLGTVDPEFYKNLMSLRNMKNIEDLGLTFETMSAFDRHGRFATDESTATSVPLCHNGNLLPVTKTNVIQYVHLMANHKLNVEGSIQARAFLRGFRDLIPTPWLRLFSASELQKLISGDDAVKGIDVENFKQHVLYSGGYHPSQPIIQWFWEVIEELTPEQQRKFLKFMTSCSRQPLLGFQALVPLPCIQQIHIPQNDGKLPTSSTCMNLLKLPCYDSKKTLRDKLLYAIEAGAGFELT